jgi:hypothetical protein
VKYVGAMTIVLPMVVAGAAYSLSYSASPVPVDPYSPYVYVSALEGRANLLSLLIRGALGLQPSLVMLCLAVACTGMLSVSAYSVAKWAGLGPYARLLAVLAVLILPMSNYAAFTGLSALVMPAALISLGLSIALWGKRIYVAVGLAFIVLSVFIDPTFSFVACLVAASWSAIMWQNRKDEAFSYAMLSSSCFLAGIAGLTLTQPVNVPLALPDSFHLLGDPLLYTAVVAVAIIASLLSYKERGSQAVKGTLWMFIPLALSLGFDGATAMSLVPMAFFSAYAFSYAVRRLVSRSAEGGEAVFDIDVSKFFALVLVLLVLSSSVASTLTLVHSQGTENSDSTAILQAASFLKGTGSTLIAPISLLPWLSVYSGQGIQALGADQSDFWLQTDFRLQSPLVRVDDWEPFSVARSPRIAVSDGSAFEYMLYIDDSYAKFTMSMGNDSWTESPYGMTYLGYRWLNNSSYELDYSSSWLNMAKVIAVNGSDVNITYGFTALGGASVSDAQISIFPDSQDISYFSTNGSSAVVIVGGVGFNLQGGRGSSLALGSAPPSITLALPLNASNGTVSLTIGCLDAVAGPEAGYAASLLDLFRGPGPEYVVTTRGAFQSQWNLTATLLDSLDLIDAYQSVEFSVEEPTSMILGDSYVRASFYTYSNDTAPVFSVNDSFVKATIVAGGTTFNESLQNGTVVNEAVNETGRFVEYETNSLMVNKSLSLTGGSLSLRYDFAAIGGNVTSVSAFLSLPSDQGYSYSQGRGFTVLAMAMGSFNLTYGQQFQAVVGSVGPGGQPGILISGPGGAIAISVDAVQPLSSEYLPASRPAMNGSDYLQVSAPFLSGPWIESPSGAAVVERGQGFVVAQGKNLVYNKTYEFTAQGATVTYRFAPIGRTIIIGGYAMLAIYTDFSQANYSYTSDGLSLEGYDISISSGLVSTALTTYGNDPVLNITYSGDALGVMVQGDLNASYDSSGSAPLNDQMVLAVQLPKYYSESPYDALVTSDQVSDGVRTVVYQTEGLTFTKTVSIPGNHTLQISYEVRTRGSQSIKSISSVVWIPWERFLVNYSGSGAMISLQLDSGQFNLTFAPAPSNTSYVVDPQPAIMAVFQSPAVNEFNYSITITSASLLSTAFVDTSRPQETGSDAITVYSYSGFLQPVYQVGDLVVYKVIPLGDLNGTLGLP